MQLPELFLLSTKVRANCRFRSRHTWTIETDPFPGSAADEKFHAKKQRPPGRIKPLGGGLLFDALGSYDLAWRLIVGMGLTAGLVQLAFALARPWHRQADEAITSTMPGVHRRIRQGHRMTGFRIGTSPPPVQETDHELAHRARSRRPSDRRDRRLEEFRRGNSQWECRSLLLENTTVNWHVHEHSDELFHVISGTVLMDTECGCARSSRSGFSSYPRECVTEPV
jgi:mannose-6-phosphate isomerase-like protein (cupin superfamily)